MASSKGTGGFGGNHYLYVLSLSGVKFSRIMIQANAVGYFGVNQQSSMVVDLGDPSTPNSIVEMQSWQE
ncbi:MAG: hypothetical protein HY810_01135 [Candidatus Omnitrophica bacterium]|nr:hypothetical protein [Candidatus Omnitrophota bacterium]